MVVCPLLQLSLESWLPDSLPKVISSVLKPSFSHTGAGSQEAGEGEGLQADLAVCCRRCDPCVDRGNAEPACTVSLCFLSSCDSVASPLSRPWGSAVRSPGVLSGACGYSPAKARDLMSCWDAHAMLTGMLSTALCDCSPIELHSGNQSQPPVPADPACPGPPLQQAPARVLWLGSAEPARAIGWQRLLHLRAASQEIQLLLRASAACGTRPAHALPVLLAGTNRVTRGSFGAPS